VLPRTATTPPPSAGQRRRSTAGACESRRAWAEPQ
jgi:hypothetical protein